MVRSVVAWYALGKRGTYLLSTGVVKRHIEGRVRNRFCAKRWILEESTVRILARSVGGLKVARLPLVRRWKVRGKIIVVALHCVCRAERAYSEVIIACSH